MAVSCAAITVGTGGLGTHCEERPAGRFFVPIGGAFVHVRLCKKHSQEPGNQAGGGS